MRATKKKQEKKHSCKNVYFIYRNKLVFSECFFLSPEINCLFFENRHQSNARARQKKKQMFFLENALPKSKVRAHLKQRKT